MPRFQMCESSTIRCASTDMKGQMPDRIARIQQEVERCPGIEFLPLRLEDAFDPSWWERVGVHAPAYLPSVDFGEDRTSAAGIFQLRILISFSGLPVTFIHETDKSHDPLAALHSYLSALPTPTALPPTVKALIRVLLQHAALLTGSSHLLYGTSLTSLAVSLISGVAQGGGFHVREEAQEEWSPELPPTRDAMEADAKKEKRPRSVRLIRPLRELSRKECAVWSWWMDLKVLGREEVNRSGAKPGIGELTKGRSKYPA